MSKILKTPSDNTGEGELQSYLITDPSGVTISIKARSEAEALQLFRGELKKLPKKVELEQDFEQPTINSENN